MDKKWLEIVYKICKNSLNNVIKCQVYLGSVNKF